MLKLCKPIELLLQKMWAVISFLNLAWCCACHSAWPTGGCHGCPISGFLALQLIFFTIQNLIIAICSPWFGTSQLQYSILYPWWVNLKVSGITSRIFVIASLAGWGQVDMQFWIPRCPYASFCHICAFSSYICAFHNAWWKLDHWTLQCMATLFWVPSAFPYWRLSQMEWSWSWSWKTFWERLGGKTSQVRICIYLQI